MANVDSLLKAAVSVALACGAMTVAACSDSASNGNGGTGGGASSASSGMSSGNGGGGGGGGSSGFIAIYGTRSGSGVVVPAP